MPDEPVSQFKKLQRQAESLMDDQHVAAEETEQPNRLRQLAHFWVMVGRSFVRNRCPVRASALAYSSLLAMIPMLALVLSVTTSILKSQGEQPIREFVDTMVEQVTPYVNPETQGDPGSQEKQAQAAKTREEAVKKINEFIDRAQTGTIGATGAIALLLVAISMLSRIETTFNDIWGIVRGRSWYMRVVLYWAAITLGPIMLISALGLTTAGQLQLTGNPAFTPRDFKNPAALAAELSRPSNEVTRHLAAQLAPTTLQLLSDPGPGATNTATLKALAGDLNKLIQTTPLYDEPRFAGVKLSPETQTLLRRTPRGDELARLNRSLLEEALPDLLAKGTDSRLKAVRLIMDLPLVTSLVSTFLPILVLSLTFAMVYLLLPNTRVQFKAALVGGLTAGLLWYLNNKLGVLFVSRITSNSAIYGSLGVVPVFMIGLYFGWTILLFGAQVAYAYQNRQAYLQERLAEGVNQRGREFAALRLLTEIGRCFQRGVKAPGLNQLTAATGVPTRLSSQLLTMLVQARLVTEVADREAGYAPARPMETISLQDMLTALRAGSGTELATRDDSARPILRAEITRVREAEQAAASAVTLRQLVDRSEGGAAPPHPA